MQLSNPCKLKKAIPADAKLIAALADEIWHEHYPPIIGEKQVEYMLEKMYSLEVLNKNINEGPQQFYLIYSNDLPCGFISIEVSENKKEGFIQKFYLLKSFRGNGLAAGCFELLLLEFPLLNVFRLQVNRENIRAINFYFSRGFKIEKSADFDIGNGFFMNDFVMVYHIKNKE
ncbi:MAG: GNAT family N-acetyltransferase [Bacteroidia bacterium]